jgi:hypothetical protein
MGKVRARIIAPSSEGQRSKNRSKISNGTLLAHADLRSAAGRRFRDLVMAFEAEVGGGTLTEFERGLVRQAAAVSLRTEQMQEALVRGEPVDDDALIRMSGEARRILTSLTGTTRKRHHNSRTPMPKDIGDLVAP